MFQSSAERFRALPRALRWCVFLAVAFGILILRRPGALADAAFFYEDGQVFYVGAFFGNFVEQLSRQYEGYLHLVPRVVAALERLVAPPSAPLVGNAVSLAVVACLAAYLASNRLANVFPDRRMRVALAFLLLVLPGVWETLGSITLVQWYLALFLVLASIASTPASRIAGAVELGAIAVAGLTGPFSILLAPLYWIRAWRRHDAWTMATALVITSAAVIQLAVLLASGERSGALPEAGAIAQALTVRLWASVLGGLWLSGLIPLGIPAVVAGLASLLLILALLILLIFVPAPARLALGYGALAIVGATLLDQPRGFPQSPYLAARYFLIVTVVIGTATVVALSRVNELPNVARVAALAVGGLLILGVVGDFRLPARPDYRWAERSGCIGGPVPCDVPVEFPNLWTIHWPGSSGTYVQPNP